MGEIPIWFFYLKEMYRGKYQYPAIRKKYKANAYACVNLFIEKESLVDSITTLDQFIKLNRINRRIELILDYQIAHYEKAYTLK